MGLEALSRGAQSLIAIEESRKLVQALEENCQRFGFKQRAEVICGDLRRVLPILGDGEADVIFADPPYRSSLSDAIVELVDKHSLLDAAGILAVEHASDKPPRARPERLEMYDVRKYGQTSISFYRLKEQ